MLCCADVLPRKIRVMISQRQAPGVKSSQLLSVSCDCASAMRLHVSHRSRIHTTGSTHLEDTIALRAFSHVAVKEHLSCSAA